MKIDKNSFAAEFFRTAVLFLYGGFIYGAIEILYRGHTHPSMFVLGGLCLVWISGLNEYFTKKLPLAARMLLGGIFITLSEFIFGAIFNLWLGLRVWDYSKLPLNILGQVCPVFFLAWVLLSLPAILVAKAVRKGFCAERTR